MADVSFQDVTKVFPGGTTAIDRLALEIPDGEFMILVGPSGCGKTTALRLVAGLESATSGAITVGGRNVTHLSPKDRDIAMVFQNYALYPHMTVYKNLAFGLRQRRVAKAEVDRRVTEMSVMLGLNELLRRRPGQLSGGQRQRVAMGRALVREPKAFLLDEPLSNLDAKLRVQMRAELKRLHQRLGVTTIYVTHDQVEAMTLGDRLAVMSAGKLQQVGTPQDVYEKPTNVFVAHFIGSPPMNLLKGTATGGVVRAGDLESPVSVAVPDGPCVVGIRPESLSLAANEDAGPRLDFHVDVVEPLGGELLAHGSIGGQLAAPDTEADELLLADTATRARITARLDGRLRLRAGEHVLLSVHPGELYLFDAKTGDAVG
ncbi:MAG: sn-glycerol-3-phosphate ABC transporter ATP-binding protein UgpC [Acidobacteriota bacterium]